MTSEVVNPKYLRNFNENRRAWLNAAYIYSADDSDFICADAVMKICQIAKISVNTFRHTYRTNTENNRFINSLSVFLSDSIKREITYLSNIVTNFPKIEDDFDRDELINEILLHISEESNLYLLDLRRKRYELILNLGSVILRLYNISETATDTEDVFSNEVFYSLCSIIYEWSQMGFDPSQISNVSRKIEHLLNK